MFTPKRSANEIESGVGTETEVERAMRVLSEPPEKPIVASVPAHKLEDLLAAQIDTARKLAALADLVKQAHDEARFETLERQNQRLQAQLQRASAMRQAAGGESRPVAGRMARCRQRAPGIYIGSDDVSSHPLLRSSGLVKMILLVFGMFLVTEPLFIGLSSDTQTMSIAFFVLTLLLGGLIAYNFVETREQELRLFFGEPEDHQPEMREPRLNFSFAAFVGALFVQLVYALMASRIVITATVVVVVTAVSCALLFFSYGFLVSFENKYQIADR